VAAARISSWIDGVEKDTQLLAFVRKKTKTIL
jgi:hypothetical protein